MKKTKKRIGILGGGQLARMMALKAHEKGYEPHVLSSSSSDPSAQVTSFWTKGDIHNESDLTVFFKKIDVALFENEFIDTHILKRVVHRTKTPTRPHPSLLYKLQDRWLQKKILQKYKIPTSPYIKIDSYEDLHKAFKIFNKKFVLKKRRFGYDGTQTFIVKSIQDCRKIKKILQKSKEGFIAEDFIPFKRELALLVVSHKKMKPFCFPLVETFQKNFRCFWVKGPIRHSKISTLSSKIKSFTQKINYEGVIAFELFETSDKKLLVNEIAPRVHNSGHYSLDALTQDQFELHIEACLRNIITPPKLLSSGFAMLNLLGKKESNSQWKKQKEVFLHIYGKKEKTNMRKMGHLNALDTTPNKALKKLFKAHSSFK